jgi:ATP/maltotriose-dependent transcriptional regulator MalT
MKGGASPISPMIARRVLSKYLSLRAGASAPADKARPAVTTDKPAAAGGGKPKERSLLSGREQEVLELIARGFSYAEIARLHGVSASTVQTHIKNLYAKLAVHSRTEAVFEATQMGLLPRP